MRRAKSKNPSAALKNPAGGLTRKGRAFYQRTEGAHLKPGVKKTLKEMSSEDMLRKGSWAVRFFGRKGHLPPLRNPDGRPTRFALTAAAWGEPVPASAAAARRIAERGRRLLARYARKGK